MSPLLVFYRIGVEPTALGALPVGAAAAVLGARHDLSLARLEADLAAAFPGAPVAALRSADRVLLRWGSVGVLVEGERLWPLAVSEPLPLTGLSSRDWTDGHQPLIAAEAPGVLALRPADALEALGMVRLDDLLSGAVIDMRYTTADNFTGVRLYPADAGCYLLPDAAAALMDAGVLLVASDRALLVYDCYRPLSVQEQMWAVFPRPGFVARPSATGSVHNRGAAVDVGLVDGRGAPVELPTAHDDFTPAAAADAPGHSPAATENRAILQAAMRAAGFTTIRSEWWHFNGPGGAPLALDLPFPQAEAGDDGDLHGRK
jgi:D-alanyl-D-alanine dipeptidase